MARDWQDADYVRVYHTIVEGDPKFDAVYDDDRALAAWLRLLIAADATYPAPPPLPRWIADDVLELLTGVGLVVPVRGGHYRVKGLQAEREGRATGRAAGGRIRAEGAERDEHGRFRPDRGLSSNGASKANAGQASKGQHPPATSSKGTSTATSNHQQDDAGPPASPAEPRPRPSRDSLLEEDSSDRARRGRGQRTDVQALLDRGWPKVTKAQRRVLDEIADRHAKGDDDGAGFAADAIRAASGTQDPLAMAIEADRLWKDAQLRRIEAEEAAWAATKAEEKAGAPDWLARLGR